jgi:hypothetical protein
VHEHTDTQRATSLLVPACQVQLAVRPRGRFPPCFALLSAMLPTAAPERGLLSPRGGARGRSAKKVRAGDRVCKAGPCCRCCTPCRRAPPAALTLAAAARAEPARVARHVAGGARERRRRRRRRSFGVACVVLRAPAGRVHAPVQRRARLHHRRRRHRAAAARAGCVHRARPCRSSLPLPAHVLTTHRARAASDASARASEDAMARAARVSVHSGAGMPPKSPCKSPRLSASTAALLSPGRLVRNPAAAAAAAALVRWHPPPHCVFCCIALHPHCSR